MRGPGGRRSAWVLPPSRAPRPPPEPLDSAILFAPVGELVPPALAALDRGGTHAVAGIHLTDIPGLNYQQDLFPERQLRSVTANTRDDAGTPASGRHHAVSARERGPRRWPISRATGWKARRCWSPGERAQSRDATLAPLAPG
jgi:hypothetical protein